MLSTGHYQAFSVVRATIAAYLNWLFPNDFDESLTFPALAAASPLDASEDDLSPLPAETMPSDGSRATPGRAVLDAGSNRP